MYTLSSSQEQGNIRFKSSGVSETNMTGTVSSSYESQTLFSSGVNTIMITWYLNSAGGRQSAFSVHFYSQILLIMT